MRLFSQNGGGSGGGGGADGPFDTHWVWVSVSGGSDASGDGTVNKPFASIVKALESIDDNSIDNPYQILVAPGEYVSDGLALKSWVEIVGLGYYGTTLSVDTMTYDAGYDTSGSAPTSIERCILSTDPDLSGDATIHNPLFKGCILQDGLTLSGAASATFDDTIVANLGATITDVYSVFSRDSSWEGTGGVTFQSETLTATSTWDVDEDRFLFGLTVGSTSGFGCELTGSGYLNGAVALVGTDATFTGTVTFGGTSLVLSGGATAAQYSLAGGGPSVAGTFPIAQGSGVVAWSATIPSGASVSWATSTETPATTGRLNFCGDAAETWIAYHYAGTDYAALATDGGGNVFLGLGTVPVIVIDAATEILMSAAGSEFSVSNAGVIATPAGVNALLMSTAGTGAGLGVQSVAVDLGSGGSTALTLGQGLHPGIQLTGALTGAATLVFGDEQGLFFVDTSALTGISALNTLTFANASGATAAPVTSNAGFYLVWVDSQGPNTILAGALTLT
jgi:hypothetical protein